MVLSVGYSYSAACLARQWIKEQGIIDMRVYSVVQQRWRTDIRRWRIDFIRWRTGRWRTDSLVKRPVTVKGYDDLSKLACSQCGSS